MTLPLKGIRIVEMGQLIAIPHACKMLADMGAEVIRIESCVRLDGYRTSSIYGNTDEGRFWDRAANFYEQNRNKMSLTLDLTKSQGLDTLKELISVSDVFAENFTPRVMRNFGLEYDDVRKLKPDIIMVSSTGYGYVGPWSDFGAIGYTTEAASGLAQITGYEDGPPILPEIPYADYTAAEHTVFAVMAALVHRANTGRGQFIDVSQSETLTSTIPEAMLDFTVNGRTSDRIGNRDPNAAPHGCYPCKGEDRWIAIAAQTDEEWRELCDVLGISQLVADPRFQYVQMRLANRVQLDELIEAATTRWDQHELMHSLQRRGVPAGAVLDGKQMLFDPHLNDRGFYERVQHDETTGMPVLPYASRPWKLSRTPGGARTAAPILGEQNREVLQDILGMTDDDVRTMAELDIIGNDPIDPRQPTILSLEDQKRQGRIVAYEEDFREKLRRWFET